MINNHLTKSLLPCIAIKNKLLVHHVKYYYWYNLLVSLISMILSQILLGNTIYCLPLTEEEKTLYEAMLIAIEESTTREPHPIRYDWSTTTYSRATTAEEWAKEGEGNHTIEDLKQSYTIAEWERLNELEIPKREVEIPDGNLHDENVSYNHLVDNPEAIVIAQPLPISVEKPRTTIIIESLPIDELKINNVDKSTMAQVESLSVDKPQATIMTESLSVEQLKIALETVPLPVEVSNATKLTLEVTPATKAIYSLEVSTEANIIEKLRDQYKHLQLPAILLRDSIPIEGLKLENVDKPTVVQVGSEPLVILSDANLQTRLDIINSVAQKTIERLKGYYSLEMLHNNIVPDHAIKKAAFDMLTKYGHVSDWIAKTESDLKADSGSEASIIVGLTQSIAHAESMLVKQKILYHISASIAVINVANLFKINPTVLLESPMYDDNYSKLTQY